MLTSLDLRNFRNFQNNNFILENNKNLIIWKNWEWKTNVLEAIGLFSNNNILEINFDNLVKKWEDFLYIKAKIEKWDEFAISFDRVQNKKKYFINNKSTTKKNLVNNFPKTVSFHPMIMNMMYLSPTLRRDFLDSILISSFSDYNKVIKNYKNILINRNKVLKNINEWKSQKSEINFWNNRFIESATLVYLYREKILLYIEENIKYLNTYLNNKVENIWFIYKTKIDRNNVRNSIENYIGKNLDRDIILKKTYIWPHLDDFDIILDDVSLINFASRWEVKSIIIWLKFLESQFISNTTGNKPIFIVDDILSELDQVHMDILLKNFWDNQTIITSIKDINLNSNKIYL